MFQIVYTPGQQDKCFICGQIGHLAAACEGKAKRKAGEFDEKGDAVAVPKKPYQVALKPTLCCCYFTSLKSYFFLDFIVILLISFVCFTVS